MCNQVAKTVTPANVLVSIYGEKQTHAVEILEAHGVTRLDVIQYLSHGVKNQKMTVLIK